MSVTKELPSKCKKQVSVMQRIAKDGPHSPFESKVIKILTGENNEIEFLQDKLRLYASHSTRYENGKQVKRTGIGKDVEPTKVQQRKTFKLNRKQSSPCKFLNLPRQSNGCISVTFRPQIDPTLYQSELRINLTSQRQIAQEKASRLQ